MKRQQKQTGSTIERFRQHYAYERRYLYYWFACHQGSQRKGRPGKPHHLRDGGAFRELSVPLDARGGCYEHMVRNGPPTQALNEHNGKIIRELMNAAEPPLVEEVLRYQPIDDSFLRRNRLLVVTTRMAMNDFQQADRLLLQPGFNTLERKIIIALRPYLEVCSKSRVRMAPQIARFLPPEFADRADIRFRSYQEPHYVSLYTAQPGARRRRPPRDDRRTAAYLVQLPKVAELGGADLLVMWGMGGTQTLAFAHLLRTDLSHLLDHYGFSMVEMIEPETAAPAEDGPMLLDFVRRWEVKVLIEGVLLDPRSNEVVRRKRPVVRGRGTPARPHEAQATKAPPKRRERKPSRKKRASTRKPARGKKTARAKKTSRRRRTAS